ncbi:MAG: hypothetical protein AB2L16_05035 [Anaerolineaceae bacterium]
MQHEEKMQIAAPFCLANVCDFQQRIAAKQLAKTNSPSERPFASGLRCCFVLPIGKGSWQSAFWIVLGYSWWVTV